MQRPSFKGDLDSHVDELIKASSNKSIGATVLHERLLVPYFDTTPCPSDATPSLEPLQGRAPQGKKGNQQPAAKPSKSQKDSAALPRKGGKGGNKGAQQQQQLSSRKHHRDPSQKNLAALATKAVPVVMGRQSPPRKRQEQLSNSGPPPDPSKFAGPAFTNSPMPDTLPIPTTSLLMHQAADQLRSGLII